MEWVSVADLVIVGGITVLAYFGNRKINKQTKVLNELQIARERRQAEAERQADLRAELHRVDDSEWHLEISNYGAPAYHVEIEFPEGIEDLAEGDLDKFPLEAMEAGQFVNLPLYRSLGNKMSKIPVRLTWQDADAEKRQKDLYPTF